MDNRLIFLYHPRAFDEAVTQKDRQSGVMVDSVQAVRLVCSEVRTPKGWAVMGTEIRVGKLLNSR